jgi:chitodextrinase
MYAQRTRLTAFALGLLVAMSIAAPVAAGGEHFRGRLVEFHGDDFARGRNVVAGFALETDHGHYQLNFRDTSLAGLVGRSVELTGTRQGKTLNVTGYQALPDGSTSTSSTTVAAAQNKNVAVLLFNFRNDTRQPYTQAFATGVFFTNTSSDANYFAEQSYGQMAMTGQVYGWYTIDYDNTGCDYTTWGNAARAAATAAGVSFSGVTNYVYAFPSAGCGWAGLAYLPGSDSYNNQAMDLRVTSHELTHNFGTHHASTYNCVTGGVRVAISASSSDCTLNEYGDPFTVMGSASTRHSNSFHKAQMGWLGGASDRLNVTVAGTYTVGAQEVSTATNKVLRVARTGASGQYFYLEYRQPYGSYFDNFASTDPVVMGVTVRVGPDYNTRTQSWLVDATPETSSWGDAALPVGRTFSDPLSGISITTQSVSADGAVVFVAFSSDTTPPNAPTNLVANGTGPYTVGLSWTAATDDRAVSGYRVSRNGTLVGTTAGPSWNDSGLTPNTTYNYSVVAYDAGNNVSTPATASGTTWVGDSQAPSAPTNLKGVAAKSGATSLTWTASTDNFGVTGYRVYRNGVMFATTTGAFYSAKKVRGTFSWYVVAFDQAGNVSSPSNTVTVTVR